MFYPFSQQDFNVLDNDLLQIAGALQWRVARVSNFPPVTEKSPCWSRS